MAETRYDMKQMPDGTWAVIDIFTGLVVMVNETYITNLDIQEADDMVDLLNGLYVARRNGPLQ
ncbi:MULTISPECIES: hypothetical protein [Brucella/Ochrobactrum group]|nr:hypothetical protein [Brucella sp. NBRC 12950]MBC8719289.1 hypothetical protein [Ochrobactrum sp. Marseille-Q0166]QWK79108.1 hypothetical protein KMS41_16535 [Ochrobactrum sp. BTU1]GLU26640.1 hypothetical protein Brsp01_18730 [Brucella sp. NBRC 12950]